MAGSVISNIVFVNYRILVRNEERKRLKFQIMSCHCYQMKVDEIWKWKKIEGNRYFRTKNKKSENEGKSIFKNKNFTKYEHRLLIYCKWVSTRCLECNFVMKVLLELTG